MLMSALQRTPVQGYSIRASLRPYSPEAVHLIRANSGTETHSSGLWVAAAALEVFGVAERGTTLSNILIAGYTGSIAVAAEAKGTTQSYPVSPIKAVAAIEQFVSTHQQVTAETSPAELEQLYSAANIDFSLAVSGIEVVTPAQQLATIS